MQNKSLKYKDMIIAVFCTILAILCIVFYFLPAFNVKHATSVFDPYTTNIYSGWEITRATLTQNKVIGFNWDGLMYIKDAFGFPVILAGTLMPLSIVCSLATAVFAYLSWLKSDTFKKFCFLFSLLAMIFQTITLILVWFVALQVRSGNQTAILNSYFYANMKGGMSYGSFVSLILVFVIAIIACAYNYFLDNSDEEEEEEEEYDDDDEYEEVVVVRRKKKTGEVEEFVEVDKKLPSKTPSKTTRSTTTKTGTKISTTKKSTSTKK